MKFDLYLKRQKVTVEQIVKLIGAESYEDLAQHFKSIGIKCPPEEELGYEFKKVVEERTTAKSSTKKKRVSNKKGSKPKTNDSSSTRRSESRQRVRKSSTQRSRKRKSNNDEPVQHTSGSEDTK
jgi:hypothetical protein